MVKITLKVKNAIFKALRNPKVIKNTTGAQRAAIRKAVNKKVKK